MTAAHSIAGPIYTTLLMFLSLAHDNQWVFYKPIAQWKAAYFRTDGATRTSVVKASFIEFEK